LHKAGARSIAQKEDEARAGNRVRHSSFWAALIVGTILAVAVGAQDWRFKTETSLVEVDVVVRDSNRQPVTGLTPPISQYSKMTFVSRSRRSRRSTWRL